MSAVPETKHARFLRLMHRRLERALEELRLVGQLSSQNYENTPEEAEDVIIHLDQTVRSIAQTFGVEYATRIGRAASQSTMSAPPIGNFSRPAAVMDEIETIRALEFLRTGKLSDLEETLRNAVRGKAA